MEHEVQVKRYILKSRLSILGKLLNDITKYASNVISLRASRQASSSLAPGEGASSCFLHLLSPAGCMVSCALHVQSSLLKWG